MIDRRGRVSFDSRQRFLLILGMAGLGSLFSFGCQKAPEPVPPEPILVRAIAIPSRQTSEIRSFPLFTKEGQSAKLSFRVPGQLLEFDPILGKRVKEGEVLARLDRRDYELAVQRLEQGINEANAGLSAMKTGARAEDIEALEAQIRAAETAAANAEAHLNRMENLLQDGTASQVQYDVAKTAADGARAQLDTLRQQYRKATTGSRAEEIEAMEAKIAGLKIELNLARNKLADTELKAPFNGFISQKYFDNYEAVAPGIAVIELVNTDRLEATLSVTEEIVLRRNDIESITCTFPAMPGVTLRGTVKEVGKTVRQKGLSYPLTIVIERGESQATGADAEILPGMTGTAELTLKGGNSTILLPSAALIPGDRAEGESTGGESAVWVISDEMRLERHPVHIKTFTEEGAVVEDGLEGGERIVGAGARFLSEGERVRTEP